jgi:hypothetical protein
VGGLKVQFLYTFSRRSITNKYNQTLGTPKIVIIVAFPIGLPQYVIELGAKDMG